MKALTASSVSFDDVRPLFDPSAILIGLLAVTTIGVSVWLPTTGLDLGPTGLMESIDFAASPLIHLNTLLFVAVIVAGLRYASATNPDVDRMDVLQSWAIGILLAVGIVIVTESPSELLTIITTVTLVPAFTAIAIGTCVAYYIALHTRYDWVAINIMGIIIVPPLIAQKGTGVALPTLVGVLVGTAILDYIAVHRTTVMESIAKTIFPMRLPAMFIVVTGARSLSEALDSDDEFHGMRMLGMGDVAIPGVFIVGVATQYAGMVPLPALTALFGYVVAYGVLIMDPFDLRAYAGLPFLNTGVLLGFAVALPFM